MKKYLLLATLIVVSFSLVFASTTMNYTPKQSLENEVIATQSGLSVEMSRPLNNTEDDTRGTRDEVIFYQEDFEDGWGDWYSFDGTIPDAMWHLTDWNAYGDTGYSWWMGDPEIGGYYNHMYLALDTPEITVTSANSTLTFKLNYNVEEPGVHEDYDGWDGSNIRISTDGGDTWNVIEGLPAYNCTSMYSFGAEHGEGPGVPGWGGSSDGWVDASFDLSDYVGQNVRIRFAFASDPAYSTQDDPELFGMMVDNISLGDFDHDFNDGEEQGMEAISVVPVGGDLWHIGAPTPTPPSAPHAAVCQNDQGTYNPNMYNYIVSPPINLPSSGDIRVDFMVRGEIDESGVFPNTDFWGWEISPDAGTTWYYMSNPYNDPNGDNYVYSDVPELWSSMTASYSLDGYISEYAGHTVRFRIYLKSEDHNPVGEGLMFDNYTVYHSEYLPPPSNLTAEVDEQSVLLNWTAPGSGGSEGWIHWDDGVNNDGIGLTDGGDMDVAARFSPEDMDPYVNGYITTVKFFPREATASYTLNIWSGASGNTVEYSEVLTGVVANDWNEIVLADPVLISLGTDYWIGYNVEHTAGQFPAGCDSGPHVPARGDMIRTGAGWSSLYDNSQGSIDVNWNIQALVEILDNRTGESTVHNLRQDEITGFNIYHSTTSGSGYDLIGTVNEDVTEFIHDAPVTGATNYYVATALYDMSESGYSNEAAAFVIPETSHEFAYDDGTAEAGYNAGNNNHVAVKFIPTIVDEVQLTHVKVYVHTVRTAPMILKVWEDVDGVPGEIALAQFMYPANQIREGWNYIPIPASNPVHFTEGYFFIGILEAANSSAIGVDEDNVGSSYTKIGTNPWSSFNNGNFMIRAILDGNTGVETILEPVSENLTATNYPNPFNPETTIEMNIPQASQVRLSVYNLKGQLVRSLVNEHLEAGVYQYVWDGTDSRGNQSASGLYFYRVESEGQVINRRMLLLK